MDERFSAYSQGASHRNPVLRLQRAGMVRPESEGPMQLWALPAAAGRKEGCWLQVTKPIQNLMTKENFLAVTASAHGFEARLLLLSELPAEFLTKSCNEEAEMDHDWALPCDVKNRRKYPLPSAWKEPAEDFPLVGDEGAQATTSCSLSPKSCQSKQLCLRNLTAHRYLLRPSRA